MTKQQAKKLKQGDKVLVKRRHYGHNIDWTVEQVFPEYYIGVHPCVMVQLKNSSGKLLEYQHTLLELP
jgi:hypothetical protein